ncbi:hypothetical protein HAX54_011526 [Datura stramonium]|uniref:Uncharacterized protein n=1 Tax=Datura stramonium TaxID=4076 RepID=A0ABS8TI70_DATST|nr:hypothetical protein [Datura stramonium]
MTRYSRSGAAAPVALDPDQQRCLDKHGSASMEVVMVKVFCTCECMSTLAELLLRIMVLFWALRHGRRLSHWQGEVCFYDLAIAEAFSIL